MNLSQPYRQILMVMIAVTQIFSSVLFVPEGENYGASVFRVLLVILAIVFFVTNGISSVSRWPGRAMAVAAILCLWMLMSLAWTPDLVTGVKQSSYVITFFCLMYVIENIIIEKDDLLFLFKTVSFFGVIIAFASIYEMETGNHFFRSSIQDAADFDMSMLYIQEGTAWFTFGNPNDLTVHLAVCAFSFYLVCYSRSNLMKFLYFVYFSTMIYMSYILESRIVLVAIILFIAVCFVVGKLRRPMAVALLVKAVLVGSSVVLIAALTLADRVEFLDVSGFIRLQLILSAIAMFFQTILLGIGTGGFESEMWTGGFFGLTYGIANPHNALARILAENGIIGISLFGFLLIGPVIAIGSARGVNRETAFVAGLTVAMPLLLSSGSNPLGASSLQLAIALLWVACRFTGRDARSASAHPTTQPVKVTMSQ
ncbi:MAG: O-antigen ligase family protein [Sphingopyxis solisilvae]|uniref:O-antigen ligase family protein n=1 Tax=Sphingopyxis solisilvae TaxID=1886788 RepID=UPI00403575C5